MTIVSTFLDGGATTRKLFDSVINAVQAKAAHIGISNLPWWSEMPDYRKERKALCREITALSSIVASDASSVTDMLTGIRRIKDVADKLFALYAVRAHLNYAKRSSCPTSPRDC